VSAAAAIHANALLLRETGLLLRGPSGVGKSLLTHALVARARAEGDFAALIGDDRIALENAHGRLLARGRAEIAGLLEIRNLGILRVPFEPAGVIRCVVDLADSKAAAPERCPPPEALETEICGVRLPRLRLLGSDAAAANKIFLFLHHVTST